MAADRILANVDQFTCEAMVSFIFNYFKNRQAVIVFLTTFLIYSPVLFNHFVGDDNVIFGKNTFYHSWKNVPRLFEKGRIKSSYEIIINSDAQADLGQVSPSFRPIYNLTFFFDYTLFRASPCGSHFINILIHCVNAALVYRIVNLIFSSSLLGVFAGLLFSLHPIQSEAVAVVNCRCDLLASMFILFSFYSWVKFQQGGGVCKWQYCNALGFYFLGLFTKESTIVLPFVILLFDQILVAKHQSLKMKEKLYAGFILLLTFYLYLYLFIFRNEYLSFYWLGGSFVDHWLIMGNIWYGYLISALLPWTVKMIPALYCPPVFPVFSFVTIKIAACFIAFIAGLLALWRNHKEAVFFLLWYAVFYLPVSNLIPLADPMADRFMYLPSVGLLIALAFLLHNIFNGGFLRKDSQSLSGLLHVAVILICMTRLIFLNTDWKSNFDMGWAWVRDYPTAGKGYAFLGKAYFDAGLFERSKTYLEKSVMLGENMPDEVMTLASCYMQLGEFKAAEALLKQIILRNPGFADPYIYLRIIYSHQKNLQRFN